MEYKEHPSVFVDADKIQVTSNPQVRLFLNADDWQLYSDLGYEGRDRVAEVLNCDIAKVINDTEGKKFRRCTNVLGQWSHYGAADSEGYDMLRIIFYSVFGENYDD